MAILSLLPLGGVAMAAPATQPTAAEPRSMLEQLDRETRTLYRTVQESLVRVQMPQPKWVNDQLVRNRDNRFDRFKLNPEMRAQLEQYPRGSGYTTTTRPADSAPTAPRAPASRPANAQQQQGVVIVVPPYGTGQPQQELYIGNTAQRDAPRNTAQMQGNAGTNPGNTVVPNHIGLPLDDRGHVLVPIYLERETAAEQPVRLSTPGGQIVEAAYVGADAQTNLTIVRLPQPLGKPLALAGDKIADGALVLYVSTDDATGRLGVWNGGGDFGVVVALDGRVLGISRAGQFISGSACKLIADQIIRHGAVRRATLGVIITHIEPDDPARADRPLLGDKPAVRIDQIMQNSVAEQAGLKVGDIILSFADQPVTGIPALAAAVAARTGPTPIRVLRGEQTLEIEVDLRPR